MSNSDSETDQVDAQELLLGGEQKLKVVCSFPLPLALTGGLHQGDATTLIEKRSKFS